MNKAEYKEYLKTDHWVNFSKSVKKSTVLCEKCKHELCTEVHHLTYERLWKELRSDVVALCRHCHRDYHGLNDPMESLSEIDKKISCVKISYEPSVGDVEQNDDLYTILKQFN